MPTVSATVCSLPDDGDGIVRPVEEEPAIGWIGGCGASGGDLELDGAISVLLAPGADFLGKAGGEVSSHIAVADDPTSMILPPPLVCPARLHVK